MSGASFLVPAARNGIIGAMSLKISLDVGTRERWQDAADKANMELADWVCAAVETTLQAKVTYSVRTDGKKSYKTDFKTEKKVATGTGKYKR